MTTPDPTNPSDLSRLLANLRQLEREGLDTKETQAAIVAAAQRKNSNARDD